MPVPDDEASREEFRNLSEEELNELGVETRFWPWFSQTALGVAKLCILMSLLVAAVDIGSSFLSASLIDFRRLAIKVLAIMSFTIVVPMIVVAVSILWWYGSAAIDKLRKD